ncbi:hypothetical protein EST38_g9593 [Candolleomyces aberdarensis]|uniref:Cytochrome P450 n=1 Tax=Candolleomyces aberdarensis TaxID=2316362 RepID=A0A4Q2DB82_9AGAR|nr:hypothetical protein EST38_g9593 [Candolleomyces aberdarensis]
MALSIISAIQALRGSDIVAILLFIFVVQLIKNSHTRVHTTKLQGPPSENFFVGLFPAIAGVDEPLKAFEKWAKQYGTVFSLPMGFGRQDIMIWDIKAAAHILARDTFVYQQSSFSRVFLDNMFGKGILSAEHDDHHRHRKALTPAFSNAAIRGYVNTFNDSAEKLKATWDAILDSGEDTIEVQQWMNRLALENLGVAGFSHHFGALSSQDTNFKPDIMEFFDSFEAPQKSSLFSRIFFFLAPIFPALLYLPTQSTLLMRRAKYSMKGIADALLERMKREMMIDSGDEKAGGSDKSIIGLLIKAESSSCSLTMTPDEVLAQMVGHQNTLFFAGYETTSNTLTWALIELCRHPEVQEKLREELNQLGGDPTWEQITLGLPYLDAVTQEVLRMHMPVDNLMKETQKDDVVPLSKPIHTSTGELVSELVVTKGQVVHIPIGFINNSEQIWGPDVKEFKPERWLDPETTLTSDAKAIQGHHHIMTFSDGPRLCLGRHFALANFKTSLANLIRRYTFEMPNGKDTVVERHLSILPRPKLAGEKGPSVPLKVRRID